MADGGPIHFNGTKIKSCRKHDTLKSGMTQGETSVVEKMQLNSDGCDIFPIMRESDGH
jgi:hypothetical protein